MGIRTTGLQSNLDTESIVKELMAAKSLKKENLQKAKTKLEWKKDKWADLNKKIYALYTEQVSKLRLQSTFNTKSAKSSNENVATITAGPTATNGSYTLEVSNTATSQYLTGSNIKSSVADNVQLDTKLSDIDSTLVGKEITISYGTKNSYFQVKSDTTITDYVNALKSAGLNASYDVNQGRFFISGSESGKDNVFSISTTQLTSEEIAARDALESYIGYDSLNSATKTIVSNAYKSLADLSAGDDDDEIVSSLLDVTYNRVKTDITNAATLIVKARLYNDNYSDIYETQKDNYYDKNEDGHYTSIKEQFTTHYGALYDALSAEEKAATGKTKQQYIASEVETQIEKLANSATISKVNSLASSDADAKAQINALIISGVSDLSEFSSQDIEDFGLETFEGTSTVTKESLKPQLENLINDYRAVSVRDTSDTGNGLSKLGLTDVTVDPDGNASTVGTSPTGMAFVGASDSKVLLNGAELTSSTSAITVNGMTINLVNTTNTGEKVTLNVATDATGIYDTVKSFVKQYNELVTEMNKIYNADKAKGYEPLTDEEKEAMSDSQIELWENKIKDSLLRNDSTLNTIMSSMRMTLASSVEVNGKHYSLATFGVTTSSVYTENGLLHIYGDSEDSTYAAYTDKLQKAIEDDPQLVADVFSQVFANLSSSMQAQMASSKVSSAFTFYNDKKMASDIEDYEDQIDDWTSRLETMEDDYYSQFSAMETAMAKLNSQLNTLSSLFSSGN